MGLSNLTVSGLDRLKSRSLIFVSLISCKGALIVTPYVTIKHFQEYLRSPMAMSNLTLNSQSLRF